ncbi:MAG TPA: hypothetical protein VMR49_03695 [Candidatus Paceibacterota bacterium]|nr:hypothetical protein [Candidatus Paceibacterota bacterium]
MKKLLIVIIACACSFLMFSCSTVLSLEASTIYSRKNAIEITYYTKKPLTKMHKTLLFRGKNKPIIATEESYHKMFFWAKKFCPAYP